MKFPLFFAFVALLILSSCTIEKKEATQHSDFVYLDGKNFMLDNKVFFPMMMNYMVQYRIVEDKIIFTPTIEYDSLNRIEGNTKDSIQNRFRAHFQLLNELGFNCLRLVGMNIVNYEDTSSGLNLTVTNTESVLESVPYEKNKQVFLNALSELIEIAAEYDLKIMILLPGPSKNEQQNKHRIKYITSLLHRFRNNNTIFAYDFFNEPLYFDQSEQGREKLDAYRIVKSWDSLMGKYAPKQLSTIGYAEPLEVFEWDPAFLPVDFISFHTYHPLRVPNEIYWLANYIDKPWIIGETALPAENDSISYLEQQQFMKEALRRTVNCGGSGFGWWQFQDVLWGNFEADYTSLLNHQGITYTRDSSYVIYGSLKPAASEIKYFLKNYQPTYECPCMNNYYNMVGYNNYLIEGHVINSKSGKPIEGAVIRGWVADWNIGANTFSREDGSFSLYSNTEFVNFHVSAPNMSLSKFYADLDYKAKNESITTKQLKNKSLEYHNIGYQQFLTYSNRLSDSTLYNKEHVIFNFKDELFNQYKYKGKMPAIMLDPL